MNFERDSFRIDLRSAKLCMELDCNTIFGCSEGQSPGGRPGSVPSLARSRWRSGP